MNFSINISITTPVKAEDSTSTTERTGFGPSHKSDWVYRGVDSLTSLLSAPWSREWTVQWLCVWWTEVALERNEIILYLK